MAFEGGGRMAVGIVRIWTWLARKLRWAAGCFVFCRREAWEGSGGFEERVYASEELWFSRAVRKWGQPRGMDFRILTANPPLTSGRKLEGPGAARRVLLQLLLLNLCPWLLFSRRACFLWYRR